LFLAFDIKTHLPQLAGLGKMGFNFIVAINSIESTENLRRVKHSSLLECELV
jgi:hypothetical protein